MTETTQPLSKGAALSPRIKSLLAEGRTTEEIVAILGTTRQMVGIVRYHTERAAQQRISKLTGKPVRKYVKRKKAKAKAKAEVRAKQGQALIVVPKPEFLRMQEENAALRKEVQTLPKVVEVQVPQPFSHYTFWQRLRILFLGGAA